MRDTLATVPMPNDGQNDLSIPEDHWLVYEQVLSHLEENHIPYGIGGAFAAFLYTGVWRGTKDLDLFIQKKDKQSLIEWTNKTGFVDFYSTIPYDRGWLYRATRNGVLVDLIWSFANYRSEVKEEWLSRAPQGWLRNHPVRVLPPEELIFAKLYVMQRERCDWPDLLDLLYFKGAELDWERILQAMQEDRDLLGGLLWLFAWLCPGKIAGLPATLREMFGLSGHPGGELFESKRARLLDSRDWFAPLIKVISRDSIPPPKRATG